MQFSIKKFLVFLIIILALLAIGSYFVYTLFLVSPNNEKRQEVNFIATTTTEKHLETKSECLVRVNNLGTQAFLTELFNTGKKISPNDLEAYLKRNLNIDEYPGIFGIELTNKYFSCEYDADDYPLGKQKIYDAAVSYAELFPKTNINFYQAFLMSAKDYILNHASSTYQYFTNELIFGNWENNCEKGLASLCRPGEAPFTATGTAQWCQNLCQKLEAYKNNTSSLITEIANEQDKSDYAFKEAIAFRLGKSDLANQVCDTVKDDKVKYDTCKSLIVRWGMRLKDCQEVKSLLSKYICGS